MRLLDSDQVIFVNAKTDEQTAMSSEVIMCRIFALA